MNDLSVKERLELSIKTVKKMVHENPKDHLIVLPLMVYNNLKKQLISSEKEWDPQYDIMLEDALRDLPIGGMKYLK